MWDLIAEYSTFIYTSTAVLIVIGAIILTRVMRLLMGRIMRRDVEHQSGDLTRLRFLNNAISALIWFTAFTLIIFTIPQLRALAITLFAGAGILVAIIGFAAQAAFANIISGIFIVMSRPFRVGDLIRVSPEYQGFVDDITLRHTVIRDFQNRRVVIPNSVVGAANILNHTIDDPKVREYVEMRISLDSDMDLAMKIMREEALKHPYCIDNRTPQEISAGDPVVQVRVIGFDKSATVLRAYVWVNDPVQAFLLRFDMYRSCKKRFDEEGILLGMPHRMLMFKNPSDKKQILGEE